MVRAHGRAPCGVVALWVELAGVGELSCELTSLILRQFNARLVTLDGANFLLLSQRWFFVEVGLVQDGDTLVGRVPGDQCDDLFRDILVMKFSGNGVTECMEPNPLSEAQTFHVSAELVECRLAVASV